MAGKHQPWRLPGAALALTAAGLLLAACGGAKPAKVSFSSPSPVPAATGSANPAASTASSPLAPLTGLPASAAAARRSAVALAVAGSRPAGLSSADLVYEEVTSPIRYLCVFQSRQAAGVGPITGTRPADGPALSVLRPLFGYDGGTASFIQVLDKTDVVDLGYGSHSELYQSGAGGVTASTRAFRRAAHSVTPPTVLPYRGPETGSQTLASTGQSRPASVTVRMPGFSTQKWAFDQHSDSWRQVSGGPSVSVANLIVQAVPYHTVYLSRRYGMTTQTARVYGRGTFEAFTGTADSTAHGAGGLGASGHWYKPGLLKVTNYYDRQGFPMDFQPGTTWVILAPPGTRISTTEASG